jgi:hypothetical protein
MKNFFACLSFACLIVLSYPSNTEAYRCGTMHQESYVYCKDSACVDSFSIVPRPNGENCGSSYDEMRENTLSVEFVSMIQATSSVFTIDGIYVISGRLSLQGASNRCSAELDSDYFKGCDGDIQKIVSMAEYISDGDINKYQEIRADQKILAERSHFSYKKSVFAMFSIVFLFILLPTALAYAPKTRKTVFRQRYVTVQLLVTIVLFVLFVNGSGLWGDGGGVFFLGLLLSVLLLAFNRWNFRR